MTVLQMSQHALVKLPTISDPLKGTARRGNVAFHWIWSQPDAFWAVLFELKGLTAAGARRELGVQVGDMLRGLLAYIDAVDAEAAERIGDPR